MTVAARPASSGASFRLTSAGSAVMERMFPDSPEGHEMVNMYHSAGRTRADDPLLCGGKSAAVGSPGHRTTKTGWSCDSTSITNLSSPKDHYMHHAEYVLSGKDRLTTRWYSMKDGQITKDSPKVFELIRRR